MPPLSASSLEKRSKKKFPPNYESVDTINEYFDKNCFLKVPIKNLEYWTALLDKMKITQKSILLLKNVFLYRLIIKD